MPARECGHEAGTARRVQRTLALAVRAAARSLPAQVCLVRSLLAHPRRLQVFMPPPRLAAGPVGAVPRRLLPPAGAQHVQLAARVLPAAALAAPGGALARERPDTYLDPSELPGPPTFPSSEQACRMLSSLLLF
ncbi:unnamed protein product [Prorocentrum cordatum]|uniref:Uncharacterized protein n=1 Tax=Prorocentrum cordatum TaxID=2364126 RepID=A0ABN9RZE3_9DINO|nr:unnamed protein product [Polarella glacialis]